MIISFDLDDTLWPIRPVIERANHVLKTWLDEQLDWPWERVNSIIENGLPEHCPQGAPTHRISLRRKAQLHHVAAEAAMPAHRIRDFVEEGFQVFLSARQQVALFDGVEHVLSDLASRHTLVALTNGNADLGVIGLAPYFEAVFSADDFHVAKPDSRIFHWMCVELGVRPVEVIHVGDDLEHDVLPAHALGMRTVWYTERSEPHPAATRQVRNWTELHACLLGLLQEADANDGCYIEHP